jgi:cell wall assembly regulator SMI1
MITSLGNILPNSGNSYSGIITYDAISSNPNVREFMGVELSTPLAIGEKYFFSLFLSPAYNGGSYNLAVNNVGILFTTYSYYDPFLEIPIPNFSHLKIEEIESVAGNWKKISGNFEADSAYTNLVIGNFYYNDSTDTINKPSSVPPHRAYTLIDDVCVSTDSLYNENWITLNVKNLSNNISVDPNPSSDYIQIKADNIIQDVEMYNNLGQIIIHITNISKDELIIDITKIEKGIYYLKVENYKLKKIVIN